MVSREGVKKLLLAKAVPTSGVFVGTVLTCFMAFLDEGNVAAMPCGGRNRPHRHTPIKSNHPSRNKFKIK